MKISDVCKSCFNVFIDISNYKSNDNNTNALAVNETPRSKLRGISQRRWPLACNYAASCGELNPKRLKILSYFTMIIPLGFAAVYVAASLCGRVSKKEVLFSQDKNISGQAKKTIVKTDQTQNKSQLDVTPYLAKAKTYSEKQSYGKSGALLEYIENILNNVEFHNDPHGFMKNWEKRRGNTEEFRIPEDQARIFFEKEVMPDIKKEVTPNVKNNSQPNKSEIRINVDELSWTLYNYEAYSLRSSAS